jgi:hypothetical protein
MRRVINWPEINRKEFFRLLFLAGGGAVLVGCSEDTLRTITEAATSRPTGTVGIINPGGTITLTSAINPSDSPAPSKTPENKATPAPVSWSQERIISEIKEKGLQENSTVPVLTDADYQEAESRGADFSEIPAKIEAEAALIARLHLVLEQDLSIKDLLLEKYSQFLSHY